MPSCYKCRKKMITGFTDLNFDENGTTILVKNVPAFLCSSCSESQINASVAKDVSNIINQIVRIEKTTSSLHVKEVALAS